MQAQLCYLGNDGAFFSALASCCRDWSLEWAEHCSDNSMGLRDWRRVLLIDLGQGSQQDVERMLKARGCYAGAPWIAIADSAALPLTVCGLARMHGADAIFYKPCDDRESLCEVIQDALDRLARWEQTHDAATSAA
jgi:hypothetical protein